MRLQRQLNKWQLGVRFEKCPAWYRGFHPVLTVWYLKLTSFPDEGYALSQSNTFVVPRWLRAFVRRDVYVLPIRIFFT
jgi:hypothetical protein